MTPELDDRIFHIALRSDWDAAQQAGEYRTSTRGTTLEDVGFIHASFRDQVEPTGAAFYADVVDDAIVLEIDPSALDATVRVENLDGGSDQFPHIYGALPVAAVVAEHPVVRGEGGTVAVPGLHAR